MKALENGQWTPRCATHLGCVKGCLDYLGIEVSDGWLYGVTPNKRSSFMTPSCINMAGSVIFVW